MKRSTWIVAGGLVFLGILLLFTAGLGLQSKSMMGMMSPANMMLTPTMLLRWLKVFLILFGVFTVFIELFVISYRLIRYRTVHCPTCQSTVRGKWAFCPHCGSTLRNNSVR